MTAGPYCDECGMNCGIHENWCSSQGGGPFGRKIGTPEPDFTLEELAPDEKPVAYQSQIAAFRDPPAVNPWLDCNPTTGHTDACKLRMTTNTGRSCSKAPNFVRPADEIAWLRRELHAVRVLDAWAKKHGGAWRTSEDKDPAPDAAECRTILYGWGGGYTDSSAFAATAAAARIAAADALLKEDPSLGSEV